MHHDTSLILEHAVKDRDDGVWIAGDVGRSPITEVMLQGNAEGWYHGEMIYDFGDQVGRHSASASFSSSNVLPLGFPFCIRRLLSCQCVFSSPICAIRARSDGYSINFTRVREQVTRSRGSSLATDEESSVTIRLFAVT